MQGEYSIALRRPVRGSRASAILEGFAWEEATMAAKDGKSPEVERDLAATYNAFKVFEGQRYTGMKVGGRHRWHYEEGEWNEKKVAPDRWEISYAVKKHRHGHAP